MVDEQYTDSPSVELGRYWRIVRRRWLVVLLVALLGAALGALYVLAAPHSVTATAMVKINVVSEQPFSNARSASTLIDAQTEEQLARSTAVVSEAAQNLGTSRSPAQIRNAMSAQVVTSATIVKISYSAPTVAGAVRGADALANAYIDYRSKLAQGQVSHMVNQLQNRQQTLENQLDTVLQAISNARPGSSQSLKARNDRSQLNGELATVLNQINSLSGVDTSGGTILTDAGVNPVSIKPASALVIATGVVVGLVVGLLAALAVDRMDGRIRGTRQITVAGGGQALVELRGRKAAVPAAAADLDGFRSLREEVLASLSAGPHDVAVIDLARARTPSDVAANLAVTVAQSNRSVELVLVSQAPDYLAYLKQTLSLDSRDDVEQTEVVFRSARFPRLGVRVASDGALSHAVEDRGSLGFEDPQIRIFAVPETAGRSSRLEAARLSRAVILVVCEGVTHSDRLQQTAADVRAVQGGVLGTVLVAKGRRIDLAAGGRLAKSDSSMHPVSATE